ncbi:ATP-grasp domain-containing protein [Neobacillus sp. NPDC097160]|uniref:ATP-grasp domain-containing protein n=1 Tax=Neobacillus sp. NPDC097160 TaxID=3364298 RepID=UPI0037F93A0D
MEIIVFIGSNKSGSSREALITSTKMGYYTILLTNRKGFIKHKEEFPEVHEMIYEENLSDEEKIQSILSRIEKDKKKIAAVISFIDPFVSLAARIAIGLGLVPLSTNALTIMEKKTRFREQLKANPVTPHYSIIKSNQPIHTCVLGFLDELPLVLKCPTSNGSKDVMLASTISELKDSLSYLRRKYPDTSLLAEEYLEGTQYLIEVIAFKGEITMVAVIEQEIQQGGRFIITGYIYPAALTETEYDKLEAAVTSVISQLELVNGTCHLEMRLIDGEWKLIEINPRMSGGAMNRIIQEGTGINLVKETIKLSLGEVPALEKTKTTHVYAKFLTVNTRGKLLKVTGENIASAFEGVVEVFVKPRNGAILTIPYSLGDRYAYVIASSETTEQAKLIASTASMEIKFYLEPL